MKLPRPINRSKTFKATLVIRIPKWAKDKIKQIAKSKGLNTSTFARMWLMEKLQTTK